MRQNTELNPERPVDAVLCDLGLSSFEDWESIIDNLVDVLKPDGKFVIMGWLIEKPSLRGKFIK